MPRPALKSSPAKSSLAKSSLAKYPALMAFLSLSRFFSVCCVFFFFCLPLAAQPLQISPERLDLGFVKPGQQASASLTLKNTDDKELVVWVAVEGRRFSVSRDTVRLDAGGQSQIQVVFAAPAPGDYNAALVFEVKKLFGAESQRLPVAARVSRALLEMTPSSPQDLDLGTLAVGQQAVGTVRLGNSGVVPVRLDSAFIEGAVGPFSLSGGVAPGGQILEPGENLALEVGFAPRFDGRATARLIVLSEDWSPPRRILSLRGEGLAPQVAVSPLPAVGIDFDLTEVGHRVWRRVTLINKGRIDLNLLESELFGDAFALEGQVPAMVAPGQRLELQIGFGPKHEGPATGRLHLRTDDPRSPDLSLPLKGKGQIRPPQVEVLNREGLDFGGVAIGHTQKENLILLNRGGSAFAVEIGLDEPTAEYQIDQSSFLLQPGESRAVSVVFAPKEEGLRPGGLWVATESGRRRIGLAGTGKYLKLNPATIDFGRVAVGETQNRLVEIANIGNADFTIDRVVVGDAAFLVHNPVDADDRFLLPANSLRALPLNLGFVPTERGLVSAPLKLEGFWEEGTETLEVLLNGTGVAAEIVLHPSGPIDFGYVVLGQQKTRTLVANNTGDTALRVKANALGAEASVEPAAFDLDPGESIQLKVNFSPQALGDRFVQILLVSNDVHDRAQALRVGGKGALESIDLEAIATVFTSRKSNSQTLEVPWNNAPVVVKDGTKLDIAFQIPDTLRQALIGRKFVLEWTQLDSKYDPKGGSKQSEVHIYEADEKEILAENFNLRLEEDSTKRVRIKITTHSYPGAPPQSISQVFEAGGWKWEFEAKPLVSFLTIRPGRNYTDAEGNTVKGKTERLIGLPGLAFAGLHDSENPFISGLHLTAIGNVLEALSTTNSLAVSMGVAVSLYKDQFLIGFGRDIYDSRTKDKRRGTSDYIVTFKYSGLFKKGLFR
jgi:hypothetical protein